MAAARNTGADDARGEMLAFLDADDAWLPKRLEVMLQRLEHDGVDAVLCSTWLADQHLTPHTCLQMSPHVSGDQMLLKVPDLVSTSSNLLIKRKAFQAIGGFNSAFATSADWYLLFKLVEKLKWSYETKPLVLYRQHTGGMSRNVDQMASEQLRIYRDIFDNADADRLAIHRPAFAALHRVIAGSYFVSGRNSAFLYHAIRSLLLAPSEIGYFMAAARRWIRRKAHLCLRWQRTSTML